MYPTCFHFYHIQIRNFIRVAKLKVPAAASETRWLSSLHVLQGLHFQIVFSCTQSFYRCPGYFSAHNQQLCKIGIGYQVLAFTGKTEIGRPHDSILGQIFPRCSCISGAIDNCQCDQSTFSEQTCPDNPIGCTDTVPGKVVFQEHQIR